MGDFLSENERLLDRVSRSVLRERPVPGCDPEDLAQAHLTALIGGGTDLRSVRLKSEFVKAGLEHRRIDAARKQKNAKKCIDKLIHEVQRPLWKPAEARLELDQALARLGERQRAVVYAMAEGWSAKETALVLGISDRTLTREKELLRERLAPLYHYRAPCRRPDACTCVTCTWRYAWKYLKRMWHVTDGNRVARGPLFATIAKAIESCWADGAHVIFVNWLDDREVLKDARLWLAFVSELRRQAKNDSYTLESMVVLEPGVIEIIWIHELVLKSPRTGKPLLREPLYFWGRSIMKFNGEGRMVVSLEWREKPLLDVRFDVVQATLGRTPSL